MNNPLIDIPDLARYPWGANPKNNSVNLAANTLTPVVPADPLRVVLVLAADGSHLINFIPTGAGTASSSVGGIALSTAYPFQILTIKDHYLLVTQPWSAICSAISIASWIGVSLSALPGNSPDADILDSTIRESLHARTLPRRGNNGNGKLYSNRWRQPEALSIDDLAALGYPGLRSGDESSGR